MKPAEAAKRLNVSIDRIRVYCRIAGIEKRGCTYDISEETLDRWRRHPPGTALDYSSTVAGRVLRGQPISGENYDPDNEDVLLARAYRKLKLDLAISNTELAEAKRVINKVRDYIDGVFNLYVDNFPDKSIDYLVFTEPELSMLSDIERML